MKNILKNEDASPAKEQAKNNSTIYVNRTLRMSSIELIGFDMDHSLAIYNKDGVETLAYQQALEKLVNEKNYPKELLAMQYKPSSVIRGLAIDKRHGNVIKMDSYSYVTKVYHGLNALPRQTRKLLYTSSNPVRVSDTENYSCIDSLFELPEVYMYMQIIDFFENTLKKEDLNYSTIFNDIRFCIDMAHRDGSIKKMVKKKPDVYLVKDPMLHISLIKMIKAGKQLFLLTNSEWSYTDFVMSYLINNKHPEFPNWTDYFHFIFVEAKKPSFFMTDTAFSKISTATGQPLSKVNQIKRGKIYSGGNSQTLEKSIGKSGDQILYVGDNIYGDILRSKKQYGWRTCIIVPELEYEVAKMASLQKNREKLSTLELGSEKLEHNIAKLEIQLLASAGAALPKIQGQLDLLNKKMDLLRQQIKNLEEEYDVSFHPTWGELFKEGHELSRFGKWVKDYADVYTSRVSNFFAYPPNYYFRSPGEMMHHHIR